jgi:hypothetical protein
VTAAAAVAAAPTVRDNAIARESWRSRVVAIDALADRRGHSVVKVTPAAQRFFANAGFRFDAALRIVEVEEYWATVESPPAWRSAAAIGAYQQPAAETSA